jgi:capsid portal protein
MIFLTEEDLKELQERVLQQKMDELFEEPSRYEDDDDNGMDGVY